MNRNRILALVGIVAVLALVFWFWKGRGRAEAPRYRTAAVEQGDLTATVSATGSVRPVVQVQVGSQVSGTISELRADYNSRVRAGQVLAQIEPSSFRTRVVQAWRLPDEKRRALVRLSRGRHCPRGPLALSFIETNTAPAALRPRDPPEAP